MTHLLRLSLLFSLGLSCSCTALFGESRRDTPDRILVSGNAHHEYVDRYEYTLSLSEAKPQRRAKSVVVHGTIAGRQGRQTSMHYTITEEYDRRRHTLFSDLVSDDVISREHAVDDPGMASGRTPSTKYTVEAAQKLWREKNGNSDYVRGSLTYEDIALPNLPPVSGSFDLSTEENSLTRPMMLTVDQHGIFTVLIDAQAVQWAVVQPVDEFTFTAVVGDANPQSIRIPRRTFLDAVEDA